MSNREHVKIFETLREEQFGKLKNMRDVKNKRDLKQHMQKSSQKSIEYGNSSGKKKLKYVNFYSRDHKPGLIKGRHPCNCQATKHELINNCTKCGRIVCEQEGSGPCLFCDNMVCVFIINLYL